MVQPVCPSKWYNLLLLAILEQQSIRITRLLLCVYHYWYLCTISVQAKFSDLQGCHCELDTITYHIYDCPNNICFTGTTINMIPKCNYPCRFVLMVPGKCISRYVIDPWRFHHRKAIVFQDCESIVFVLLLIVTLVDPCWSMYAGALYLDPNLAFRNSSFLISSSSAFFCFPLSSFCLSSSSSSNLACSSLRHWKK